MLYLLCINHYKIINKVDRFYYRWYTKEYFSPTLATDVIPELVHFRRFRDMRTRIYERAYSDPLLWT